jgi:hypothetical protein
VVARVWRREMVVLIVMGLVGGGEEGIGMW